MPQVGNMYANAVAKAFSGTINWANDSIRMGLLTSAYTPSLSGHVNWSDVNANEVSSAGTNYTTGGQALTSKTLTVTTANSWTTVWAGTTAYAVDAIVIPSPANGFLFRAAQAGTSAAGQPVWPTIVGETVNDGTVIWTNMGESITAFGSAAVSWANSTITAAYGVIYDAQTGVAATEPLIALLNFGGNNNSSAGPFTLTPNAVGWFIWTPA